MNNTPIYPPWKNHNTVYHQIATTMEYITMRKIYRKDPANNTIPRGYGRVHEFFENELNDEIGDNIMRKIRVE